jgi:prolipoprotein diacylglyceryltransferase
MAAGLAVAFLWIFFRAFRRRLARLFLLVAVLLSASRLFLEAFRGDSVFLPGGFREAQLIALVVIGIGFYWMRKWINLEMI